MTDSAPATISISVVIPTYHRQQYLQQAITSAANQSYRPDEIVIICDDETIGFDYDRCVNQVPVRAYALGRHAGSGSVCRNQGIARAAGEWIAFLDDDDTWHPDKLREQVAVISRHPNVAFIYSDYYIIDADNMIIAEKKLHEYYSDDQDTFIRHMLVYTATGPTSSYLIRKSALAAVGGFDETLPSAQDYDISMRLLKHGTHFRCVPKPLMNYRLGNEKLSLRMDIKETGIERVALLRKNLFPEHYYKYRDEIDSFHYYSLFMNSLFCGETGKCFKYLTSYYRSSGALLKCGLLLMSIIIRIIIPRDLMMKGHDYIIRAKARVYHPRSPEEI